VSVSNRTYREAGGFRIIINVPRGAGTATMRDYGASLANLFRDVRIGAIDCRAVAEPFTDDQSDKGLYYQGAMVVEFARYFTG